MNLKAEHIPHYTYDDYKLWKDGRELIFGFPFSMSPSATGRHQSVIMKLTKATTGKSTFTLSGDCEIILDFSVIW